MVAAMSDEARRRAEELHVRLGKIFDSAEQSVDEQMIQEIERTLADVVEEAVRTQREVVEAYEGTYARLKEMSALGKLDSDVWYALTKAHQKAEALRREPPACTSQLAPEECNEPACPQHGDE
jgi:hypothetical protein